MPNIMNEDATTQPFSETAEVVSVCGGRIEVLDEDASLQVGVKPQMIGRSPRCDLVLDDRTVSALHVEVQATPLGVRVLDLKSRNGSFLFDARFNEVHLNGQWDLRCGAKRLRFIPDPPHDVVVDSMAGIASATSRARRRTWSSSSASCTGSPQAPCRS
jgi:hypothetical protein